MIGVEVAFGRQAAADVPEQGVVGCEVGAVDEAVGEGTRAVIFADQGVPVIEEPRVGRALDQLPQAAERIVGQGRGLARGSCGDEPVLAVVDVGVGPVAGEVAVGIVGMAGSSNGGVLIEAVDAVGFAGGGDAGERISVVGAGLAEDLRGGVEEFA
jgi:hypothetical protein